MPEATLQISVANANVTANTNEGVLIPNLSKERISKMPNPANSTLVYVDDVLFGGGMRVSNINSKGYYYFDAEIDKWVKLITQNNNLQGSNSVSIVNNEIQRKALIGDVTADANGNVTKVVAIQGNSISDNIPQETQVLRWDGAQWKPEYDRIISFGSQYGYEIECNMDNYGGEWLLPEGILNCYGNTLGYVGKLSVIAMDNKDAMKVGWQQNGSAVGNNQDFVNRLNQVVSVYGAQGNIVRVSGGKTTEPKFVADGSSIIWVGNGADNSKYVNISDIDNKFSTRGTSSRSSMYILRNATFETVKDPVQRDYLVTINSAWAIRVK